MNRKQRRQQKKTKGKRPMSQNTAPSLSPEQLQKNELLKKALEAGIELVELKKLDEAEAIFKELLTHEPGLVNAYYQLALLEHKRHNTIKSIGYFELAVKLDPDNHNILSSFAYVLLDIKDLERAEQLCKKSLSIKETVKAHNYYSMVLKEAGRFDEAAEQLRRSIALKPLEFNVYRNLGLLSKFDKDDPIFEQMLQFDKKIDRFEATEKAELSFALAKAYEDMQDYDTAFTYYKRANDTKNPESPPTSLIEYMQSLPDLFTPGIIQKFQGHGNDSHTPIFIIGMPRSGKTLTEKIIARHPDIFPAGELYTFKQHIDSYFSDEQKQDNPHCNYNDEFIKNLTPKKIKDLGDAYVAETSKLNPAAQRITDTMPFNSLNLGMIRLALPHAKIIYCQRDPMDIGLSIYRKNFLEDIPWAYDLQHIGSIINTHTKLMAYWQDIFGDDIYVADYEKLVEAPFEEAEKLISFCGLDWARFPIEDDSKADPTPAYESASINKDYVEEWRKYEKYATALAESLARP